MHSSFGNICQPQRNRGRCSLLILLLGCILPLVLVTAVHAQASYRVIVHADNPMSSISKAELSDLFLKKASRWQGFAEAEPGKKARGEVAAPIDLANESTVREGFSAEVHGRSVERIESYWQRRIFSGRDVPPRKAASESEVVSFVRSNRGAVGYVGADVPLGPGVKVLAVSD